MAGDEVADFSSEIKRRRETLRLSVRAASRRAAISEARWRQLEQGEAVHGGVAVPAIPKETTARAMARAVGWDEQEAARAAGYDAPHDDAEHDNTTAMPREWLMLTREERELLHQHMIVLVGKRPQQRLGIYKLADVTIEENPEEKGNVSRIDRLDSHDASR